MSNPSNVTGSLPLNEWHMDGSTYWQGEGWDVNPAVGSVVIMNGSNLVKALELGWKVDNVEVRHVLPDQWDFRKDYALTGEWEKTDDSGDNHLGFHVYLSEYASTGFVQHVKHLHVNPGNPVAGTTNSFSLSVSGLELIDVHVNPSNHIGITFLHSEDEELEDEVGGFSLKNDQYAVDNLVLSDSDSAAVAAMILHPVYLSGSGKNTNDGLNPATPWKNFTAVNTTNFGPGAQILFNRGETFTGRLVLDGSGIASDPIIISAYGTGEKPLLQGGATSLEVIRLTDNEGLEISDLRISNTNDVADSKQNRHGINIVPPEGAGDLRYLRFINLDFTNIYGASTVNHDCQGIYGNTAGNDDAVVPTRWNDMLIDGCTFSDIDGRGVQILDKCLEITDVRLRGYTNYYPTLGFVFQNNYGTNCYRNMVQIRGTKDALIEYNTMDTTVVGSAFWPFATEGTLVQFNVFKHLRKSTADSYVCHFDFNCIGTVMQYNYGYDVEGGLIQLLVNSDNSTNFQEGAIARYNIGVDCGWRNTDNGAGIFITGKVDGGQIYNNTVITTDMYPSYKAISFNNWGGAWPKNNKIHNNIFYATGSACGFNREDQMVVNGNMVSHNLYHGNISASTADSNPFAGNPLFANPAGVTAQDFKVLFGSAAISNGLLIADNGGRDWFGYAVSSNGLPTLGFHEYQTDPVIDSDDDGMVDQWESGYGLNPGSAADAVADPDQDKLKNLIEFAVGGNPTNGNDIGYVPTFETTEPNRFTYVYPRRTDWEEIGLEYDLGVTTNLVTGPWINWAHWISGVGSEGFGAGFDTVTNNLALDNEFMQRFIRLEVGTAP
ncbi:MAG: hypothetical protein K9M45_11965 [Kiritimatiellales bacterium]|nr:hypothetical protein [Kiritimatiellales bacterium]